MKATLLCRGDSLQHVNLLEKSDRCILVNAFHYELDIPDIHSFVSAHEHITHVVSLGAQFQQMIKNDVYKKYNIDEIVLPYISETCPPIPNFIRQIEGRHGKLPVHVMSDSNKQYMISTKRYSYTSPTAGMDALLYIANDLKATEIDIIGMDFYDNSGYLTNSHGRYKNEVTKEGAIRNGEDSSVMKKFLLDFVNCKKNIIFNLYTAAKITSSLTNLKIIQVND